MIELIKRTKLVYAVYNFFHKRELAHNVPLFQKIGLKKKYYSSLSSRDFADLSKSWSEKKSIDDQSLAACSLFNRISYTGRESLLSFGDKGFAIIDNYLTVQQADAVNAEISGLLEQGKLRLNEREGNTFFIGNKSYADYENMIAERIKTQKLEKVKFFAKKCDRAITK